MDLIRRSFRDSFRRRGSSRRRNGQSSTAAGGNNGAPSAAITSDAGSSSSTQHHNRQQSPQSTANGQQPGAHSKPQIWQQDDTAVRTGTCNFSVKYLGAVEVFESRGMQVCEEALKVLRAQRRRTVKGILYVSGDGLRIVDVENNRGLLLDQTIEKVSFCAPDRNHERGFAYICRDGTTRRWMCHGFHASKDTGERLSHAVGCAFAVCLERKQKRDREAAIAKANSMTTATTTASSAIAGVTSLNGSNDPAISHQPPFTFLPHLTNPAGSTLSNDNMRSTVAGHSQPFQRIGSFRHATLAERKLDPQNVKVIDPPRPPTAASIQGNCAIPATAVPRPSANLSLFERQGSLRMPKEAYFKRQSSLRIGELPSTLHRQQEIGLPGNRVSAIPEESPYLPKTSATFPATGPDPPPLPDRPLPSTATNGGAVDVAQSVGSGRRLDNGSASLAIRAIMARADTWNNAPMPRLWDTSFDEDTLGSATSTPSRSKAQQWLESTMAATTATTAARISNDNLLPTFSTPPGRRPPLHFDDNIASTEQQVERAHILGGVGCNMVDADYGPPSTTNLNRHPPPPPPSNDWHSFHNASPSNNPFTQQSSGVDI